MLCGSADVTNNPQKDPYYQIQNNKGPKPNVADSFSVDMEQIKEDTDKEGKKKTTITYGMVTMLNIFLIIQNWLRILFF